MNRQRTTLAELRTNLWVALLLIGGITLATFVVMAVL